MENVMNFNKIKLLFIFAFLFSTTSIIAQEIVLYGNVSSLDENGSLSPIHEAYIVVDGADSYDYSDEDGTYEFSFLWNWDGPIYVICEAEGYDTQTAIVMPEGEGVQLNFILSISQHENNGVVFGTVFEMDFDDPDETTIGGAIINFFNSMIGDTYTIIT